MTKTYTVLTAFWHGGLPRAAGDTLTLSDAQADTLLRGGNVTLVVPEAALLAGVATPAGDGIAQPARQALGQGGLSGPGVVLDLSADGLHHGVDLIVQGGLI
jgi:hypothetical protein